MIIGKIQDKYLSESAIARLKESLEKEQQRTKPRPRDLKRLKTEVEKFDRKIDIAEEAVLESPPDLRPVLYRKRGEIKSERDSLSSKLEALSRRDTRPRGKDDLDIDRAIEALKNLGEAFKRAKPEDTRELLSSIVTRIELRFDHEETGSGRHTSTFRDGTIYLRPDAGEARSSNPKSTQLSKIGPVLERREYGPDLR